MIIKEITLENIRSYKNERIEMPKGSVLLWGDVGAGKSTILYALDFALFGSSSSLDAKGMLRRGSRQGRIKVWLEVEGKDVIIERVLELQGDKIKNDVNYITVGGYREKISPTDLKKRVFKLLGYPLNLSSSKKTIPFRYTVYVPQERMKEILFAKDDERLAIIRSIFDIEKYKTAVDNAKILRREINKKIEREEGRTEILKRDVERYEEVKKSKEQIEMKLEQLKKHIDSLKTEVENINNLKEEKESLLKDIALLESNIKDKERDIHVMENELKMLEENINKLKILIKTPLEDKSYAELKEFLVKKKDEILALLEELSQKIDALEKEKAVLVEELKDEERKKNMLEIKSKELEMKKREAEKINKYIKLLMDELKDEIIYDEKELNKIKEEIKSLHEDIKIKERELRHIEKQIYVLNAHLENKRKDVEKIKSLNVCPVCRQTISTEHIKQIEEEYETYKNKISKEIEELEKRKNEVIGHISNKESTIQELEKKVEELLRIKEMYIKYTHKRNELNKYYQDKKLLEKEIERLENEIEGMKVDDNKIVVLEERISKIENNIKEILTTKMNTEREKSTIDHDINIVEKVLISEEELSNKKKVFEIKKREIMKYISSLEQNKSEKINRMKEIEKTLNEKIHILEEYEKLLMEYSSSKGMLEKINEELKRIEMLRDEMESILKKIDKYKQIIEFLDIYFIPLMEKLENTMLYNIRNEFNKLFREYVSIILPHTNFYVELDESFYPRVMEGEYEMSYDYLSGGERQSIALSYRLALNNLINTLMPAIKTRNILILDEPTDGFSTEQIESMKDLINNLKLNQLIIVSHEEIVKDLVDKTIKIEKVNGVSRVVK